MNRAGLAACLLIVGSLGAQHAKAVGDTRTLNLHHVHTNEDLTITYKKNGQYDEEALKKINWIMPVIHRSRCGEHGIFCVPLVILAERSRRRMTES